MKTNIFLVRHGETEHNVGKKITGQKDSNLTLLGVEQARLTGEYLKKYNISSIYSSDLGRAYKTALIIGKSFNKKPLKDKRLRENNLGTWTELSIDEINKKRAHLISTGLKREDITPPGGENTYDHVERVMQFLNEILIVNAGKNIIIVAHSRTNKVLISYLNNTAINNYYNFNQSNCCINRIEYDNNYKKFKILTVDYIKHLKSSQ